MQIYLQAIVNLSIIRKCSATREEGCKTSRPNIYNDGSAIIRANYRHRRPDMVSRIISKQKEDGRYTR